MQVNLIFDFDSTFITVESFDYLAEHILGVSDDEVSEIKSITDAAMSGEMSFEESLQLKIGCLACNQSHLNQLVDVLHEKVSPSIKRNKAFIKRHAEQIYILSSGLYEIIEPIVTPYGIKPDHIIANRLVYDYAGNAIGVDKRIVLSQDLGKVKALQQLKLAGRSLMIGDGYTDFETKAHGQVSQFCCFTESVVRDKVLAVADMEAKSLEGLLMQLGIELPPQKSALLCENIHPQAEALLSRNGFAVTRFDGTLDRAAQEMAIDRFDVIGVRSKSAVTEAVLSKASNLKAIGAFCIGTNQIDLKSMTHQGLACFNAPFSNTRSVVELTLGLIILLLRQVPYRAHQMQQGQWQKSAKDAWECRGKCLGIVGYGNIGSQLSVVAESLGLQVIYYDLVEKLALGNAKAVDSLTALLNQADVVSLHVDGRAANHHLIDAKQLAEMKPGAHLINLSRGHVVDLDALEAAITSEHLKGAAIDVFPDEPAKNTAPFDHPLRHCPNVILTPHIGGSTQEAQANIGEFVATRLIKFVQTANTQYSVNLPSLSLPPLTTRSRLLHSHENVPGLLAQINQVFGTYGLNVTQQHLSTSNEIGLVVSDIEGDIPEAALAALKAIPQTKQVRLIEAH